MAQNWTVDNWQIPVPLGDCSIHLLVNTAANRNEDRIVHAFIMDGGKPSGGVTATEQILLALSAIDKHHKNYTWKFDAWVVTHWDHDHYAGVQSMLADCVPVTRNGRTLPFRDAYFRKNPQPVLYCGGVKPDKIAISGFNIKSPLLFGLLGVDLFTGDRIFNEKGAPKKYPKGSVEQDQPRFCVVGANGVVVGQTHKVYNENPKQPITPNETSILAVVYWPGEGGGKTSYFTGGDGNPDAEVQGVVPFLKGNIKKVNSLPKAPVNMVKLDHHGSSRENLHCPELTKMLLPLLKPVNLLVTPGDKYGHPTWDVLYFLFDYIMKRRRTTGGEQSKLFTTRSPYWMITQGGSGLNVGHVSNLTRLMERHLDDEDSDEENDIQRAFSTQRNDMKRVDKEYKAAKGVFKDNLPPKPESTRKPKSKAAGNVNNTTKKKTRKKDDKPYAYVMQKGHAHQKLLKSQLRAFLDDPNSGSKREPKADEFQLAHLELDNFQREIRDVLNTMWHKISDQDVIIEGNQYWLIHFWFDEMGSKTHIDFLDDNGEKKIIEYLDPEPYKDPSKILEIGNAVGEDSTEWEDVIGRNIDHLKHHPLSFFTFAPLNPLGTSKQKTNHPLGAILGTGRPRDKNNANRDYKTLFDPLTDPTINSTTNPTTDLGTNGHHKIPNNGEGLLCGIFALRDSVAAQLTHLLPNNRPPTDEELYHEALGGPAAQVLNLILPGEEHTRNFTADHLASIIYEWGERQDVAEPLQLGIIRDGGGGNGQLQPLVMGLPEGEDRDGQRVWILHEGGAGGGHYSGVALGKAGSKAGKGGKGGSGGDGVIAKREDLNSKLELLARKNQASGQLLRRGRTDLGKDEVRKSIFDVFDEGRQGLASEEESDGSVGKIQEVKVVGKGRPKRSGSGMSEEDEDGIREEQDDDEEGSDEEYSPDTDEWDDESDDGESDDDDGDNNDPIREDGTYWRRRDTAALVSLLNRAAIGKSRKSFKEEKAKQKALLKGGDDPQKGKAQSASSSQTGENLTKRSRAQQLKIRKEAQKEVKRGRRGAKDLDNDDDDDEEEKKKKKKKTREKGQTKNVNKSKKVKK